MEASGVDPRDTTWEWETPTYRAYFWSHPQHPSDEWRLTGAQSVFEVIAWAEDKAGIHRTYQVGVEARDERGQPGLIRLLGGDDPANGSPCA